MPVGERKGYKERIRESVPDFNLDSCYKYELVSNFYLLEEYLINGNDLDNLAKALIDAIQPKLGLDDNCFYRITSEKIGVYSEGDQRIEFSINQMGLSLYGERAKQIAEYAVHKEINLGDGFYKNINKEFGWSRATINKIIKTSVFQSIYNKSLLFL